jgi:Holliday junction DNA helicase RuvA
MMGAMIAQIYGRVVEKEKGTVILRAGDIGYRIHVTSETYERLTRAGEVMLHTHLAIRENAQELYGF